ncbi:hypothetical protein C8R45DRAFT_942858 [Mycena sanguinolenta]|nr:hypothetical protein C8R45DRAFT_942858 [Mycena sanguinolenta]
MQKSTENGDEVGLPRSGAEDGHVKLVERIKRRLGSEHAPGLGHCQPLRWSVVFIVNKFYDSGGIDEVTGRVPNQLLEHTGRRSRQWDIAMVFADVMERLLHIEGAICASVDAESNTSLISGSGRLGMMNRRGKNVYSAVCGRVQKLSKFKLGPIQRPSITTFPTRMHCRPRLSAMQKGVSFREERGREEKTEEVVRIPPTVQAIHARTRTSNPSSIVPANVSLPASRGSSNTPSSPTVPRCDARVHIPYLRRAGNGEVVDLLALVRRTTPSPLLSRARPAFHSFAFSERIRRRQNSVRVNFIDISLRNTFPFPSKDEYEGEWGARARNERRKNGVVGVIENATMSRKDGADEVEEKEGESHRSLQLIPLLDRISISDERSPDVPSRGAPFENESIRSQDNFLIDLNRSPARANTKAKVETEAAEKRRKKNRKSCIPLLFTAPARAVLLGACVESERRRIWMEGRLVVEIIGARRKVAYEGAPAPDGGAVSGEGRTKESQCSLVPASTASAERRPKVKARTRLMKRSFHAIPPRHPLATRGVRPSSRPAIGASISSELDDRLLCLRTGEEALRKGRDVREGAANSVGKACRRSREVADNIVVVMRGADAHEANSTPWGEKMKRTMRTCRPPTSYRLAFLSHSSSLLRPLYTTHTAQFHTAPPLAGAVSSQRPTSITIQRPASRLVSPRHHDSPRISGGAPVIPAIEHRTWRIRQGVSSLEHPASSTVGMANELDEERGHQYRYRYRWSRWRGVPWWVLVLGQAWIGHGAPVGRRVVTSHNDRQQGRPVVVWWWCWSQGSRVDEIRASKIDKGC